MKELTGAKVGTLFCCLTPLFAQDAINTERREGRKDGSVNGCYSDLRGCNCIGGKEQGSQVVVASRSS